MTLQQSHILWLASLLVGGLTLGGVRAQEALTPWIGGMPGTEHPAAWALQQDPWAFGLQHATRWAGAADPIADQWFSAGWNPTPDGTGWTGAGLGDWAFGTAHSTVQAGNGWRESRHALHAAVRVPLDQGWTGSAGLGIGARTWVLDGRSWSWDAQYGPGGYNPTAPSGEPDGLVAGAGIAPELALSIAAGRRPRQGPALQGAISLHHVLPVAAPTFQPMAGDTASRTVSAWLEVQDDLGVKRMLWTAWWRGAIQGPSQLIELGSTIGWTFGNASRHTRNTLGHRLAVGALWRTDGRFRIPFSWEHGELRVWTGPAFGIGHPSPAAGGWALGAVWAPDFAGSTPIGSN